MIIQNTTLYNRSKRERLASERKIPRHHADGPRVVDFLRSLDGVSAPTEHLLHSIGVELLGGRRSEAIDDFLAEYSYEPLELSSVPHGAFDLLGSVYQYLSTKAESLQKGAFYTGKLVASDIVSDLRFDDGQTIVDPACGSGSLLFASNAGPDQIVGVDNDPIAVMIAKFNFFLKFPEAGRPSLYCANFFSWYAENRDVRFQYVVGNPPYGGEVDRRLVPSAYIRSGESFSHFVELGYNLLADDGILRYLVPEAMLNVTRHTDVRDYLLDEANLRSLKRYTQKFTGVMSDVYCVEVDRGHDDTVIFKEKTESRVSKEFLRGVSNRVLTPWDEADMSIVSKARERGRFNLKHSVFGLGVVTGDNKTKLFPEARPGTEPIYTGKEVERYRLLAPRNHLVFDRSQLQQVAPDELYRAPEKLVYKVISKDFRFALDDTGSLTTNSANLLIPKLPGYDVASVMALLNSALYSFLHAKLFGGVNKIAKNSLLGMPFPEISFEENGQLVQMTKQAAVDGDDEELQAFIHEEIFGLDASEVVHIRQYLAAR